MDIEMKEKMKTAILFVVFVILNDITLLMACFGLMPPIITIIGHLIEFPLWFKIMSLKDDVGENNE